MLVDLPGYGYARAAKTEIHRLDPADRRLSQGPVGLRRLCLLVDGRHGLKKVDERMMAMLDAAAVPYQIVLTKADKVKQRPSLRSARRRSATRSPRIRRRCPSRF